MSSSIQMQKAIQIFVAEVTELAGRAAVAALRGDGRRGPPAVAVSKAAGDQIVGGRFPQSTNGSRIRAARLRSAGEKRPPEQLQALRDQLLEFVQGNPGTRAEDISSALGTTTKEIALPLRQLVAKKVVRIEGQRRGSRYFAATA